MLTGTEIKVIVEVNKTKYVTYKGDIWTTIIGPIDKVKEDIYSYSTKYTNTPNPIHEKTDKEGEFDDNGKKIGENFCSLLSKDKKRYNILNNTTLLFNILESNSETADMVDLTKYLLYKATGKDFGVKDFDFSILNRTLNSAEVGSLPIAVDKNTYYLTKEEFVSILQDYQTSGSVNAKTGMSYAEGFKVFQDNAEFIYEECLENGINPILCVVQGIQESGWGTSAIARDKNNYWGIGASDTGNGAYYNATSYSNFKDALSRGYINLITRYVEGGSKYSTMQHYVELYQPVRPEITINSIYAMTAVYAPIYSDNITQCFKHNTAYNGGVYKQKVVQECIVANRLSFRMHS